MQNHPISPPPRYGTGQAISSLQKKLQVEYHPNMQDWSYEIANPNHIEDYLTLYTQLEDEDELFVLMETIIQANEEQENEKFDYYWAKTKLLLQQNFELHQYTIFYWCCLDNKDLENCFFVSKEMRNLWFEQCLIG